MAGTPSTPLIAGCGDVGRRLARLLIAHGDRPVGLVRTQRSADELGRAGIAPFASDLDRPIDEPPAAAADGTVFYLVPPPPEGGEDDPRLRHFLRACAEAVPRRLVYLSTSGVYGDCGGEWVNETREPAPVSDRARRRLAAETIAREWCDARNVPLVILRVGGIYGPGRLPLDRLGKVTLVRADQAPWTNRIHSADLVTILRAAGLRGRAGAIYNVADGHPTTMTDYFYRIADALGRERPPAVPLAKAPQYLSPGMLSFVRESRRLDISRMVNELQATLAYPSIAQGLADALASDRRMAAS